jgi:hypothetical protein
MARHNSNNGQHVCHQGQGTCMTSSYIEVHTTQNHHFHARALQEPDVKEVVPQIKVGLDPHVGLTQGHKGRYRTAVESGEISVMAHQTHAHRMLCMPRCIPPLA